MKNGEDLTLVEKRVGTMEHYFADAMVEHLAEIIAEFDTAAGARLAAAMSGAVRAEVEPDGDAEMVVAELSLPDEDDRHVLAAAAAVAADVLCTDILKDFPEDAMDEVGSDGRRSRDLTIFQSPRSRNRTVPMAAARF